MPPPKFADLLNNRYVPVPEVLKWARATILTEGGALYNEDHAHPQVLTVSTSAAIGRRDLAVADGLPFGRQGNQACPPRFPDKLWAQWRPQGGVGPFLAKKESLPDSDKFVILALDDCHVSTVD